MIGEILPKDGIVNADSSFILLGHLWFAVFSYRKEAHPAFTRPA